MFYYKFLNMMKKISVFLILMCGCVFAEPDEQPTENPPQTISEQNILQRSNQQNIEKEALERKFNEVFETYIQIAKSLLKKLQEYRSESGKLIMKKNSHPITKEVISQRTEEFNNLEKKVEEVSQKSEEVKKINQKIIALLMPGEAYAELDLENDLNDDAELINKTIKEAKRGLTLCSISMRNAFGDQQPAQEQPAQEHPVQENPAQQDPAQEQPVQQDLPQRTAQQDTEMEALGSKFGELTPTFTAKYKSLLKEIPIFYESLGPLMGKKSSKSSMEEELNEKGKELEKIEKEWKELRQLSEKLKELNQKMVRLELPGEAEQMNNTIRLETGAEPRDLEDMLDNEYLQKIQEKLEPAKKRLRGMQMLNNRRPS